VYRERVALNIKNPEVERLATEVARMAGETKTEAIRKSLVERRQRLELRPDTQDRLTRVLTWLETEVWPHVPDDVRGTRITREEEDEILGFGPDGV
jgi:antitoxin VapB